MNIYVGNLSPEVTQEELQKEFMAFGRVISVIIIKDRDSGRPRGFGFVDMPSKSEGQAAITGLNGKTLKGQPLKVNEARLRPDSRGKRQLPPRSSKEVTVTEALKKEQREKRR